MKDTITEQQADDQLLALIERESRYNEELDQLAADVRAIATPSEIKAISAMVTGKFRKRRRTNTLAGLRANAIQSDRSTETFQSMDWADKRGLASTVLAGEQANGKDNGVWIYPIEGQKPRSKKIWRFELHGTPVVEGIAGVTQFRSSSPAGTRCLFGRRYVGC